MNFINYYEVVVELLVEAVLSTSRLIILGTFFKFLPWKLNILIGT